MNKLDALVWAGLLLATTIGAALSCQNVEGLPSPTDRGRAPTLDEARVLAESDLIPPTATTGDK